MLSHYGDCGLKRRIPTNGTLGTLGRWFPVTRCAPYTLKPGGDKALDGIDSNAAGGRAEIVQATALELPELLLASRVSPRALDRK